MRFALYFIPGPDTLLAKRAATWLGFDINKNTAVAYDATALAAIPDLPGVTANPRRYGFHATVKAPFRPGTSCSLNLLLEELEEFTATNNRFILPKLCLARVGSFFCLVPSHPSSELDTFCAAAVRKFDRFRAPLNQVEIERRKPHKLSRQELQNLHQWGYPYVFSTFRFHMTLTNKITEKSQNQIIQQCLLEHFSDALQTPPVFDSLCLMQEPEASGQFKLFRRFPLGAR